MYEKTVSLRPPFVRRNENLDGTWTTREKYILGAPTIVRCRAPAFLHLITRERERETRFECICIYTYNHQENERTNERLQRAILRNGMERNGTEYSGSMLQNISFHRIGTTSRYKGATHNDATSTTMSSSPSCLTRVYGAGIAGINSSM